MSMNKNEQFLKEANRLNGGAFHQALKEMRSQNLERLALTSKDEDFRFLQGVVHTAGNLIDAIEGSRGELDKLSQARPDMSKSF